MGWEVTCQAVHFVWSGRRQTGGDREGYRPPRATCGFHDPVVSTIMEGNQGAQHLSLQIEHSRLGVLWVALPGPTLLHFGCLVSVLIPTLPLDVAPSAGVGGSPPQAHPRPFPDPPGECRARGMSPRCLLSHCRVVFHFMNGTYYAQLMCVIFCPWILGCFCFTVEKARSRAPGGLRDRAVASTHEARFRPGPEFFLKPPSLGEAPGGGSWCTHSPGSRTLVQKVLLGPRESEAVGGQGEQAAWEGASPQLLCTWTQDTRGSATVHVGPWLGPAAGGGPGAGEWGGRLCAPPSLGTQAMESPRCGFPSARSREKTHPLRQAQGGRGL